MLWLVKFLILESWICVYNNYFEGGLGGGDGREASIAMPMLSKSRTVGT